MAESKNSTNQILDVSRSMGDIMSQVKGKFPDKAGKILAGPKNPDPSGGIVDPLKSLGLELKKLGSKNPATSKMAPPDKKRGILNFDVVNEVLGKGFPIEGALEKGGDVKEPGNYIVGENGPEVVNLPEGSSVIPLDVGDLIEGLSRVSEIERSIVDNKISVDTKNRLIKTESGDLSIDMLVRNYSSDIQMNRAMGVNTDQSVLALSSLQKLSEKISKPPAEEKPALPEAKSKLEQSNLYKEAEIKSKEEKSGVKKIKTAEESLTNKSSAEKTGEGGIKKEVESSVKTGEEKKSKTAEQNLLSKTKGPTPAEIESEKKRLIEEDPEWYSDSKNLEEEIDYFVSKYNADRDLSKKKQTNLGEEKIEKSKSVEDSTKLIEKSKPALPEQELAGKKPTDTKKETPNKASKEEKTRKRVESAKERGENIKERRAKRKKSETEAEVISPSGKKTRKGKAKNRSSLLEKLNSNLKNREKKVGRLDINKIRDLISGKSPVKGALRLGGEVQDTGDYLVGENGPEVVNVPSAAPLVPIDVSDIVEGLNNVSEISKSIIDGKLNINPSSKTVKTEGGDISIDALTRGYLSEFTASKTKESALIVSSLQKLSDRISSSPVPSTPPVSTKKEEATLSKSKSGAGEEKIGNEKKETDAKTAEQNLLSKNKTGPDGKGGEEKKAGTEDKSESIKSQSQTAEQKLTPKAKGPTPAEIEAEKKKLLAEDPDWYSDPDNMDEEIEYFIRSYNFKQKNAEKLLSLPTSEKQGETIGGDDSDKKSKSIEESTKLSEKTNPLLPENKASDAAGKNLKDKKEDKSKSGAEKKGLLDKLLGRKKPEQAESKTAPSVGKEEKPGGSENKKESFLEKGQKPGIIDKIKDKAKDVLSGKPGSFKESLEEKLSSKLSGNKGGILDVKKEGERGGSLIKGGTSPLKQALSAEKVIPGVKVGDTKGKSGELLGGAKAKMEKSVSSLSLKSPDIKQPEKPKESPKPQQEGSKSPSTTSPPKEAKEEKPSSNANKGNENTDSKSGGGESTGAGNMDDIKGLLSQIAISLSSPVTFYNPDPFRPDSRRI